MGDVLVRQRTSRKHVWGTSIVICLRELALAQTMLEIGSTFVSEFVIPLGLSAARPQEIP